MLIIGIAMSVIGLLGLVYCIQQAMSARRKGLKGEEMVEKLRRLIPINLAAFALSGIGLALVVVAVIL